MNAFFLVRMVIQTLAIMVIAYLAPGLMTVEGFTAALAAAFVLGLSNTFIRPLFVVLTIPLTLFTFGFFLLVVNALLLMLVSALVPGFEVSGFWGAMLGSVLVSIVSWLLSQTVP